MGCESEERRNHENVGSIGRRSPFPCLAALHRSCLSPLRMQLLALIGEQFDVGSEICGAALSVRAMEDSICIWNRRADNKDAVQKIRYAMQTITTLLHCVTSAFIAFLAVTQWLGS